MTEITKTIDIAIVGLSCVDCVARADTVQLHVQNPVGAISTSGGGLSNALSAISGLGLQVAISTRIGADLHGQFLRQQWERMGVDTRGVKQDAGWQTGYSFMLNHGQERTPFYSAGANASFCLDDIPASLIASSRALLVFFAGALPALDGAPLLELAKRCNRAQTAIIVDVSDGTQANYTAIRSYLPYVNLVVNAEEGERITGEHPPLDILRALDAMDEAGTMFRGVTRKDGVTLSIPSVHGREYLDVPSPFYGRPVQSVIGAGDAFRAGLAAYMSMRFGEYLRGKLDYRDACLFASAVAYAHLSRAGDGRSDSYEDISALLTPLCCTP